MIDMCDKCNRLVAAIQYEADYLASRRGSLCKWYGATTELKILYSIEQALIGILDNLEQGRGL